MRIPYYLGWFLTKILSKCLARIKVSGKENFPRTGGFILASNHISHYDPPLVGSWCPRMVYFLAKRELFKSILGPFFLSINALPVKRGAVDRKAIKLCVTKIKEGHGMVIFPEGTRCRTGDFLPPKPGLGRIAREAPCPIIPTYIHGANRPGAAILGRVPMSIVYGPPMSAEEVGTYSHDRDGWRKLSEDVMARIKLLKQEQLGLKR